MELQPPWTRVPLVHESTNLLPEPVMDAVSSAVLEAAAPEFGPFFIGKPGMKYRTLLGAIRNFGAPNYWQLIEDSAHVPSGIASVQTTVDSIIVHYDFQASAIGTVIATPDETMAKSNYFIGASVAKDKATFKLGRRFGVSDYVYYDVASSSWKSSNNQFTGLSFSAGVLTLTHPEVRGPNNAQATARGGAYIAAISASGSPASDATTTKIEFYDYAGVLQTVPNANMRVFVQRSDIGGFLNPQNYPVGSDATFANIWLYGIHEFAN